MYHLIVAKSISRQTVLIQKNRGGYDQETYTHKIKEKEEIWA